MPNGEDLLIGGFHLHVHINWSLDRLQEGLYFGQSRQVTLEGRVKTVSHIRWQGRSFLFHWEGNILAECSKLGCAVCSLSLRYMPTLAPSPCPNGSCSLTSRGTSVAWPSPKKDGGCKPCLGPIPPCPERDGGDDGAAPSPAKAWDGGAVCTPSSASGDGGALWGPR